MLEVKLRLEVNEAQQVERMEAIDRYIHASFPDCSRTECFAERAIYKIPQTAVPSLAKVFNILESGKL